MKRTYQIDERKAIEKFRLYLVTNPGSIQMVVPLAEVAQRLRRGVSRMLFETERELLMLIMLNEAAWLSGSAEGERWGTAPGSVIIHGRKIPIVRPRVRHQHREMKLGSYELFRQENPCNGNLGTGDARSHHARIRVGSAGLHAGIRHQQVRSQ
jgi:hypothetical protein